MNVYSQDGTLVAEGVERDSMNRISFNVSAPGTYICRVQYDQPMLYMAIPSIGLTMQSFVIDVHADGKSHFKGVDAYMGDFGFIPEPIELDKPAFLPSALNLSGTYASIYGSSNAYIENTYDTQNRRTLSRIYLGTDSSGTLFCTSTYAYNADGMLATVTTDATDNTKDTHIAYAYSGKKPVEVRYYSGLDSSGTLTSILNFTYNADGRLTNCKYYFSALNSYTENSVTYNPDGRVTGITCYRGTLPGGTGKTVSSIDTVSYDSNGCMIGYTSDGSVSGNDVRYDFTLNSSRLPVSMDTFMGDLPGAMTKQSTANYTYGGIYGLITGKQDPNMNYTYSYDPSWAQTSLTVNSSIDLTDAFIEYSYDADGNLSTYKKYSGKTAPSGTPDASMTYSWIFSN
jgi:hypothetical protein